MAEFELPEIEFEDGDKAVAADQVANAGAEIDRLGALAEEPDILIDAQDIPKQPVDASINPSIDEQAPMEQARSVLNPADIAVVAKSLTARPKDSFDNTLEGPTDPIRSMSDDRMNTLPVQLPKGATYIDRQDMPNVLNAMIGAFPSMNEMGMVLDPIERTSYAISVMSNTSLRSDLKAQIIETAMQNGKIVPEALGKDWYEARGIALRLPPGGLNGF